MVGEFLDLAKRPDAREPVEELMENCGRNFVGDCDLMRRKKT